MLAAIFVAAWLGSLSIRRPPITELRIPLTHNLLVEPLDSEFIHSLRVYAMPARPLRDSLVTACADFRRDSMALARTKLPKGAGQVWWDRWRDMNTALGRRVDELRAPLVIDSAMVSPTGTANIRMRPGSRLILGANIGVLAEVLPGSSGPFGDQLVPLGALCSP
jgi:hypothetical protein